MWATQSAAPAQQWNQPTSSNAAVNVNASTANVGQNSALWPPAAGANPGMYFILYYSVSEPEIEYEKKMCKYQMIFSLDLLTLLI